MRSLFCEKTFDGYKTGALLNVQRDVCWYSPSTSQVIRRAQCIRII